jgi:hypothetical protein
MRRATRPRAFLAAMLAACPVLFGFTGPPVRRFSPDAPRALCVYSQHSLRRLASFSRLIGRPVDCVVVYNDAAPDWRGFERPWFVDTRIADFRWGTWARTPGTQRRLIVTQPLVPGPELRRDWRALGARGAYDAHFRALARNLVAAGLGRSVIRLAHEANDSGNRNSIGATARDARNWRRFWARAVRAMRSVRGARFRFDWTVNAYWRPVPLSSFYPGDGVVDIVGVDAYDAGVPPTRDRWRTLVGRPTALADVVRFARAHHKPLSIPEWGLTPSRPSFGAGDDPTYVAGIAGVVHHNRVAYEAYWYAKGVSALLVRSPRSLAVFKARFGTRGDAAPHRRGMLP